MAIQVVCYGLLFYSKWYQNEKSSSFIFGNCSISFNILNDSKRPICEYSQHHNCYFKLLWYLQYFACSNIEILCLKLLLMNMKLILIICEITFWNNICIDTYHFSLQHIYRNMIETIYIETW